MMSQRWPLATRMSCQPSRSTSMNIVPHDQPLACTPAYMPDLGERAVAAIEEQRVALLLQLASRCRRASSGNAVCVGICVFSRCESLASMSTSKRSGRPSPFTSATSTPIAELLDLPLRRPVGEPEVAVAVVEPELVDVLEVVADVEVGRAVAVQVDELGVERERLRLLGERLALRVEKAADVSGTSREVTVAVVVIEVVGRAALRHAHAAHVRAHRRACSRSRNSGTISNLSGADLAHHLVERALLRRNAVVDVVRLVVRDVHVEAAVAVDVGHRDRRAAVARRCRARGRDAR